MIKKKLILLISVIAVVISFCGYLAFNYWKNTPEYSMMKIIESIKEHDVELFNKYVDMENATNRLIDDIMEISINKMQSQNQWEKLGQEIGKGLVNFIKPQIVSNFKGQVERYIETGDFVNTEGGQEQANIFSLQELQSRIGNTFKKIKFRKSEGKIALLGIVIFNKNLGKEVTIDLKFRKKEQGYWQLVEISNISKLLEEINNPVPANQIDNNINKQEENSFKKIFTKNWINMFTPALKKRMDEALNQIEILKEKLKMISINPKDAEAYNDMGIAYYRKGNYDMAIELYEKAIRVNPKYSDAYYNMGLSYREKGDEERVMFYMKKAAKLGNKDAQIYIPN